MSLRLEEETSYMESPAELCILYKGDVLYENALFVFGEREFEFQNCTISDGEELFLVDCVDNGYDFIGTGKL